MDECKPLFHGRVDGSDPTAKVLLIASHLDTVRDAGKYDGALGVIVGGGLHSFPFQLNLSSSVHRITQLNS